MKTRTKIATAVAVLSTIALAACGQANTSNQLTNLNDTYWKVDKIPGSVNATMHFDGGGRLTGFSGCNRFFATYRTTGQSIEIKGIGGTKKMCPPVEMSVEHELLKTLGVVNRWQGDADNIELTAPVDKTIIRLKREKNEK